MFFVVVGLPVVCLLAITVLYILIYRTLKKKTFKTTSGSQSFVKHVQRYLKQGEAKDSREVKTTILLFITVTAAYFLLFPSYVPFAISRISPDVYSNSIYYVTLCMSLVHQIINTLLYAFCISNIRNRGRWVLRRLFCCKEETNEVGVEASESVTQPTGL